MNYFIHTFGCQQNIADSERIAASYEARGFSPVSRMEDADTIILNTCVVRERAEEKVHGLIRNIRKGLHGNKDARIVITGCLIGAAMREPSGKMMKKLKMRVPDAEFLPLEEVGFEHAPIRTAGKLASVVISNGCDNFCSYCIVPFSRGKERSRPFQDIVDEVKEAITGGKNEIMLLGQNVNSYGADFLAEKMISSGHPEPVEGSQDDNTYILSDGTRMKPVMVKHLNRHRIPTLFPYLLETVAALPGVEKVSFLSSNPWDFSDELIDVIARNKNIDRLLHLPIQAGSDAVLKRMNRWYTREEYFALVDRIREKIPDVRFTTDIIVGFSGETEADFEDTLRAVRRVRFEKAYIAWYSPRPGTNGATKMEDDVPFPEKKRRFDELDRLVLELSGRGYLLDKSQKIV